MGLTTRTVQLGNGSAEREPISVIRQSRSHLLFFCFFFLSFFFVLYFKQEVQREREMETSTMTENH